MTIPQIGVSVKLYPTPLARHPDDDGKPQLRRVSDGPADPRFASTFLPDAGAERPFDYYWHDRLLAGDVCLTDPSVYAHGLPEGTAEIKPRQLAPGERLQAAPLPPGLTAIEITPTKAGA